MPFEDRDILIGKIVAPFGIRGEVKVVLQTDFPERVDPGNVVTIITSAGKRLGSVIESSKPNKGGYSVKFKGITTRNEAEELRGSSIVIDEALLVKLPDDSWYVFDLVGLKVVTDDGREQGEITEILQGGANDVYVTSTGLCIPALKDVVAKVDLENRQMIIHAVPGLLPED